MGAQINGLQRKLLISCDTSMCRPLRALHVQSRCPARLCKESKNHAFFFPWSKKAMEGLFVTLL